MKNIFLLFVTTLIFYTLSDLIFSNYIFKKELNLKYDCFDYKNYTFNNKYYYDYKLLKNCKAIEKQRTVKPYKVLTDHNGYRFSGKKKELKKQNVVFLGDSFTYGLGVKFEDSFPGIVENKAEDYNIYNLGVPSYGTQKYYFTLNEFLKKNKVSKVFLTLDLTDVSDAAYRWIKNENIDTPVINSKRLVKDISSWKKFKNSNFKGTKYIIFYLRNSTRYLKIKFNTYMNFFNKGKTLPTQYAFFTYEDLKKNSKLNKNNFTKSIRLIEKNILDISDSINTNDADFYIIILPWPDTLVFGQDKFNWENYSKDMCSKSNCKKLINLFDDFREIKEKNENWVDLIYIKDDVHLTKFGNNLVADKIINEF